MKTPSDQISKEDEKIKKKANKKKKVDDMNKSNSSIDQIIESIQDELADSFILSLHQTKGQKPKLNVWNIRTGQLHQSIETGHISQINQMIKLRDFEVLTAAKDSTIKLFK